MNPAIPAQADTLLALGEGPTSAPPHTGQPPMTYLHEKGRVTNRGNPELN